MSWSGQKLILFLFPLSRFLPTQLLELLAAKAAVPAQDRKDHQPQLGQIKMLLDWIPVLFLVSYNCCFEGKKAVLCQSKVMPAPVLDLVQFEDGLGA